MAAPSQKKMFISHSHVDNEFVERLAKDSEVAGITSWLDLWEVRVGDSLRRRVEEAIGSASWLAVVLSRYSVTSHWVQQELSMGFVRELEQRQIFVLPLVIDDCDIPLSLRDKFYADFRKDYRRAFDLLLATVLDVSPVVSAKKRLLEDYFLRCDKQLPLLSALLGQLVSAGVDLHTAMRQVASDIPSPLREEWRLCISDIGYGSSTTDAVMSLRTRVPTERMRAFTASIRNSITAGASLTAFLDRLQNLTSIPAGHIE